jgi:DNA-binding response OmpR family regulator
MMFSSSQDEPSHAPRSLRIIVVDDDRDAALTLALILRNEGYDTRALYSGRTAMSAVIEGDPDVVVLDINLPEISGWQIAQTIRARGGRMPLVIGISGVYKSGADRALAQVSGFDHYLVKPCPPSELLKLIEPLRSTNT